MEQEQKRFTDELSLVSGELESERRKREQALEKMGAAEDRLQVMASG